MDGMILCKILVQRVQIVYFTMIYYVVFVGLMTLENIREVLTADNSKCFIDNLNKTKVKRSVQGHISAQIQQTFQHVTEADQDYEDDQTTIGKQSKYKPAQLAMDTSKTPYFTEVVTNDEKGEMVICFASIVNNCHILTAAHCVTSRITYEPKALYRVLDNEKILVYTGCMTSKQHDVAKGVWIHPHYLQKPEVEFYKDIALVRTSVMLFSDLMQKVPIHPLLDVKGLSEMKKCSIVDWSKLSKLEFNLIPATLISQKECKAMMKDIMDEDDQVCVWGIEEDMCRKEQGAGLNCEGKLLAVTSWGKNLDDDKTKICVYSRVDTALELMAPVLDIAHCKAASLSPTLTTLLNLILLHCTQYY